MKAAVIGAGISGVTTAYYLSQNNIDVKLIESRRYPGMATSYANGGQFLLATQRHGIAGIMLQLDSNHFLNDRHSSVIMNPFPSITRLMWLFKFIKNIKNNEKITYDICQMAI